MCGQNRRSEISKWPKFKFHENWPKNYLGQKNFLDQLQLLDCDQCAKNEHPTITNGSTIPCQVNREYIRKTQKGA